MNQPRFDQPPEEQLFWDRLADMPLVEVEGELILRKEKLTLEYNMMNIELREAKFKGHFKEAHFIGIDVLKISRSLSVINERLKYTRKILEKLLYSKAIKAVCTPEIQEEIRIWILAHEDLFRSELNKN